MATTYERGEGKEPIICQSLTFGYLYDIEVGVVTDDNLSLAIMDSTGMDMDMFRSLRRTEIPIIWEIIKRETYPEIYDEDGNEIPDDEDDEQVDDKKKV